MSTRQTLESTIFGQDIEFEYSERGVGYALFLLRIVMGWTLFHTGYCN